MLPGFRAMYYRFPEESSAVIVLTNSEPANTMVIAEGVADILLQQQVIRCLMMLLCRCQIYN
ncbi:hypothetical protein [Chitinophaga filiformis]|uniref:hypothetical protein n=1 Tax=Chitinophaga filiformis TaxID=104663 RepID=UPI003979AC0A